MNHYPHHIGDFNNATRHLTRVERSVYRDAIERYYDTEQPLTKDFQSLAKRLLCFSDEEKTALKSILAEFFVETEDGFSHCRCEAEIEKYRANTSAKARAGKASAEARRAKSKQKRTRVEHVLNSVTTEHEQNSTNQKPVTINHKPKERGRFTPPSLQEVESYCAERSNGINAGAFVDFYQSKNWMVGKNKMKDWMAAVRTWEKRGNGNETNQRTRQSGTALERFEAGLKRDGLA